MRAQKLHSAVDDWEDAPARVEECVEVMFSNK